MDVNTLVGSHIFSERSYHVHDFKVAIGEGDGVGRSGNRQHERQRGGDGAGKHDVQRVDLDGSGLDKIFKKKTFTNIHIFQNVNL